MKILKQLNDLQQAILEHYNDHDGISADGAKTEFLNTLYRWPTFGSAFFEVRVSKKRFVIIIALRF